MSSIRQTAVVSLNQRTSTIITYQNNSDLSIGLDAAGMYSPDLTTTYVSSATTVNAAIAELDARLFNVASNYATLEYVNTKISNLIGGAPLALDTLAEIDTAIGNDANISVTLNNAITAENNRARASESNLTYSLFVQNSNAMAYESTISSFVILEASRARLAEFNINLQISNETTTAISGEQNISTLIATETATRIASFSNLTESATTQLDYLSTVMSTSIGNEFDRANITESTLTLSTTAETTRATNTETNLTNALNNEATRTTNFLDTFQTNLNTEVSRSQNMNTLLSTRVQDLQATALYKDGSVALTGNLNLSNYLITNLSTPVDLNDAANKVYVDQKVSSIGVVFSYVGTVSSGQNLDSLTYKQQGAYYKYVGTRGTVSYNSGATVFTMTPGDSVVRNMTGTWDLIDTTDATLYGTTNVTTVTGNANDGYYVAINSNYQGQTSINTVGTLTSGAWQGTVVSSLFGGTGFSNYTTGDLLVGNSTGSLSKLPVGAVGTILRTDNNNLGWVSSETSNITMYNTSNVGPLNSNLQQGLDFLHNYSQIRQVAQHVIANSTDFSDPNTPNITLMSGKVNFIDYNASNVNIYMPPTSFGVTDGTVFRVVHNGNFGDNNYMVKYRNSTTGNDVNVLELAPKDSISLVYNQASTIYLFAVGI